MTYQLTSTYIIIKTEDDGTTRYIPSDLSNRDRQDYQAWLAADENNQPLPADGE